MATYDYRCVQCDKVFEVKRSMSEDVSYTTCPDCLNDCKQVILKAPIFEEAFPGSYRSENPKIPKW